MSTAKIDDRLRISSRLSIPRLKAEMVRRPRLIRMLERGSAGRLIFMQAPAGFGKTCLLTDWLEKTHRRFAWFSLDRIDSGTDSFLADLEASVDLALGEENQHSVDRNREAILLSLAARIAESFIPLIIVIDGFHNATDTETHGLVARFCGYLPPDACLVAASRQGCPFPVARLRALGELCEIRPEHLRFTRSEAGDFISRVHVPRLSDEDALTLVERTEGWIAGIQLALIALGDGRDPAAFLAGFSGHTRSIHDFLAEEALDALSREDLEFLAAVSVCDTLTAPLCEAVTGRIDAFMVLRRLETVCLFLEPLDDERGWYRLQALFREALLERCRLISPDAERHFRSAASQWFEHNGFSSEALRQAVLAGDRERASALSERSALSVLERGNVGEIRFAFEALGDSAKSGPWLSIAAAWVAAYSGDIPLALSLAGKTERSIAAVAALLATARKECDESAFCALDPGSFLAKAGPAIEASAALALRDAVPGCRSLAGQVEALLAYAAWLVNDSGLSVVRALRAQAVLPESDLAARCHVEMTLGCACYRIGAYPECIAAFKRSMELSLAAGICHIRYLAAAGMAEALSAYGNPDSVRTFCHTIISEAGAQQHPSLGSVFVVLSQSEWERNDIGAALESSRRALELCLRWGQADGLIAAYVAHALALSAAGDFDAATGVLKRASRLESVSAWHKLTIDEACASIELERDRPHGADAFGSQPQAHATFEGSFTRAAWLIARKRPTEAFPLLDRLREQCERRALQSRLVETHILYALAWKARGRRKDALACLEAALRVAGPQEIIRRFVRRGKGLLDLLEERTTASKDIFAERVLEAIRTDRSRRKDHEGKNLSAREQEILRLLAEGRTAEGIAELICVAPSTVRSHIKALYSKLGAHGRIEALRLGRERGLL